MVGKTLDLYFFKYLTVAKTGVIITEQTFGIMCGQMKEVCLLWYLPINYL